MIDDIKKAVEVLQNGGVILYPTDTIWGIGCDATNPQAVKRVYDIKKRVDSKALLVLLENQNRLEQYVTDVPEVAWELIEATDKPLTIIYSGAKNLAENLIAADGSIGIRIVCDNFCEKLINRFRKPIVSSSANISGETAPANFDDISEEIKASVDYIVQWRQDEKTKNSASSILKLDASGKFSIIR